MLSISRCENNFAKEVSQELVSYEEHVLNDGSIQIEYENPLTPKLPLPDSRDTHLPEIKTSEILFWSEYLNGMYNISKTVVILRTELILPYLQKEETKC